MRNEVVKYHNDLNTVPMRNWTKEEMNFFFSIIAKLRDEGTREVTFGKYELADLADYTITHNKRFEETMENLIKKISQIHYIERTSNSLELMNLFSRFKVNWSDDLVDMTAIVKVTEEFEYVINQLNVEFTSYELKEFTTIRSTYAKTVYRLLKQWRTVGKREFNIDDFKRLLDTPKYYTPSEIDKNILKPVMRELPVFFKNLKVKKVKANTRGTPVTGYIFTWDPEKTGKWVEDKYDVDGWFEKQANNSDGVLPVPMVNWLEDDNNN
ncbi:MAG: replication initiation protein [Tetragenococcus halophilus]|nr:replication initiation protein [Tetragenococcus halophilus]